MGRSALVWAGSALVWAGSGRGLGGVCSGLGGALGQRLGGSKIAPVPSGSPRYSPRSCQDEQGAVVRWEAAGSAGEPPLLSFVACPTPLESPSLLDALQQV